jgi:ribosome maturation factor RimP
MAGHGIIEKIKMLVAPIIAGAGLELVDAEFKHEGQTRVLRIFIDKPGGVTLDDCQRISRECEVVLDVEDIIQTQYMFEVSSPGLDRPLRTREDYRRFKDRLVKLKTYRPIQGRKTFLGYLQGMTEETATEPCMVILHMKDDEDIRIPYEMITSARLEVEF